MARTRTLTQITLLPVALAAALVSCTGSPPESPSSTSSKSRAATSGPTSKTTVSIDDPVSPAGAVVVDWWRTYDRISQDPAVPIADLLKVSRGAAYETWAREAQLQRAKRWRQIGTTLIVTESAVRAANVGSRQAMSVQVCYDVSKVNMVGPGGKSVISASRIPRAKASYVVVKFDDGWFVVNDDTTGDPC